MAQGGQKAVYSARHLHLGPVALKVLSPSQHSERFDREIAAIQSIALTQVPEIIDFGVLPAPLNNHLWMLERWIPGVTLRERIVKGGLTDQLILRIATDMLTVLAKAESLRVVHRDIKPENIIISPDESMCLLIDFGIARHLDKTSLTGAFMPCTIGYAPIEQLNVLKHEIDTRSDLFSLGVTLYECCEGVNPYTDEAMNAAEVIERISGSPLPKISRKIGKGDEFANLVEAMTRIERIHRVRTASEALEWIKEITINQ